jgi:hypothetical protein
MMRFFDHQKQKKAETSSYDQQITPFPGNHFQLLAKKVNDLQSELELRHAQQLKNSVSALTNKNRPNPSISLFAPPKPKPKPRAPHLELVTRKISNPRTI